MWMRMVVIFVVGQVGMTGLGRYRIHSVTAPGVTAGNALDAQPGAFEGSVNFDRLDHIIGTGGIIAAGSGKKR